MKNISQAISSAICGFTILMSAGCGPSDTSDSSTRDNTDEVNAYYASFKRVTSELKQKLRSGEVTQEEFDAEVEQTPLFFTFKTLEDLPNDLQWESNLDLPDIGSPEAKKGGTRYGAIQDYPRTLRTVGPDSNGSFRAYIQDDTTLGIAHRHPNVTEIGPTGHYYFPGLGKEWAVDKSAKTVYVRLNPDARWSDGEPVTTEDFFFMFFFYQSSYIQAPWYNNFYTETYTNITSYDDHTFSVSTSSQKPDLNGSVLDLRPVPRHFYYDLSEDFVERYQWLFQPTTGPYIVKEEDIRKGRSIALTRNTEWWAKDLKFWRNRFNADRIQLSLIRDIPKVWEAFKRGDLDGSGLVNLPEYWYDRLPDNDPDVAAGYIHKATFYNQVPQPTYGFWINQAQPLLNNRDIRTGIHYAINFERVISEYFRGDYARMRTTSDGYGEFTHPTLTAREYDPNKALEWFAKAGFTRRGADGILINDSGQKLSFSITTGYRSFEDMLTIIREEAAKAGLDLRLDILDSTAGWKKIQEKKHDLAFSAFNVMPEMYPRFWETYHSVNAYDVPWLPDGKTPNPDRKLKPQTNNLQSIAIPELDKMIEKYDNSNDVAEMKRLAFAMEELLHEDASFVPGFVQPFYRTAHWRWIRYPDDFNVKLSRDPAEYFLSWTDPDLKEQTLRARKNGETFPPQIRVYDQYKEEISSE